ncbi:DUF1634 domain-containing protein [Olivibacter sitiensis]|uniref:DUF1634 domain-containing protein n=1 Tax=Olivibacter sitiensis TaxID=376470 RepID=UPI0003FB9877|nr:DUF1634 domain-containing protein [Olivibacter sitiensis]
MQNTNKTIADKDIQQIIGNILRYGIWLALGVAAIGGIIYIYRHAQETVDYSHFVEHDENLFHLVYLAATGMFQLKGRAIILVGVLLLFLTPVLRLIFSLVAFLFEKDYLYVVITALVIVIICVSIFFGFSH